MIKNVAKSLPKCSGGTTEITKTSLRDQATLTFTRLAVETNRFNQFANTTQLEHIDEGRNFGKHRKLRVSVSAIKSSRNGYSLSRTTKVARKILLRCLSRSSSVRGLLSKPRTRHPGVSRLRSRSLAKCRIPSKYRKTSKLPCLSTNTSFRHIRQWNSLSFLEVSVGLVTKNRAS